MNYLAHFHFCNANEGLIVGALLGDFIKGPLNGNAFKRQKNNWHAHMASEPPQRVDIESIIAGIQLHRDIDAYFDTLALDMLFVNSDAGHPIRHLQTPKSRRYLPIALDLIFDYALSLNWSDLEKQSLDEFNQQTLYMLNQNHRLLPERAQRLADRLQRFSLLTRYNDKSMLREICLSIAGRLPVHNTLLETFDEAWQHQPALMDFFDAAYPKIKQFSETWRQDNMSPRGVFSDARQNW